MAVTHSALAHAMARDLARLAPREAGLERLWVWSQHGYVDPERDYVELTVFNEPATDEAQQQLDVAAATLHDLYPEVNIFLHTFSSCDLGGLDPEGEVRPGAEEIDLSGE